MGTKFELPEVKRLLGLVYDLEGQADALRKRAGEFREVADGIVLAALPTVEEIMKGAAEVAVRKLADGFRHLRDFAQPADAAFSHHAAFATDLTQWLYLELAVHNTDREERSEDLYPVRVMFKMAAVPAASRAGHNLLTFGDAGKESAFRFTALAADAVPGVTKPVHAWGGGEWYSLVVHSPLSAGSVRAAARGFAGVTADQLRKVVPPPGW